MAHLLGTFVEYLLLMFKMILSHYEEVLFNQIMNFAAKQNLVGFMLLIKEIGKHLDFTYWIYFTELVFLD